MQAVISNSLVNSLKPTTKPFEVRDTRLKGLLLRVQPSGVMSYVCEYGRGKRVTIGRADALAPAQARQRAKTILADAYAGHDPMAARRQAKAHTLRSFVDEVYTPWAEANIRTTKGALYRLRANFPDLQNKKLGEINAWVVERWRVCRLKAGTKASTVNRDLDDLRSALAKAVAWGLIEAHPLADVKRSRIDTKAVVRFLDDGERTRLMVALDAREERIRRERDRANAWRTERSYPLLQDLRAAAFADHLKPLVIFSLHTGARRGELFHLTWGDVDLARGNLTVRGENAKSLRTRHIPLNAEALATLRAWRKQAVDVGDDALVFPGKGGRPLTNTRKSWEALLKEAGISNFRWHDLRHDFASRLVMAGIDLNTVRELLGHSDYQMTLRYAHLAPEHKAAAVARLVSG